MIEVTYTSNHICSCGYGVLLDSIPLGTVYVLDTKTDCLMDFRCGGCKNWVLDQRCMFAYRGGEPKGFLPVALFLEFQQ